MAFVIIICLIVMYAFVNQAIYILRTGQITWFFGKSVYLHTPLKLWRKIYYAIIHLLPASAIVVIWMMALIKADKTRVLAWMRDHLGTLLFALFFLVYGFLYLVWPDRMLRWNIRTHPEIADNKSVIVIARIIAVFMIGSGLVILATL
jgi:hypothetical protein